ncbi:MAG TPA: ribosome small subunit-dependent GTPase A [Gemmatimonadaceae bacterium]|jgi:ribosome biogenesis GTPase|nr:ribosome small subunit-dependent GTPase A [Gemmatimonadaceae bacterium]
MSSSLPRHSPDAPRKHGVVLSGTGGVWRVRVAGVDGFSVHDAALRGRLKQEGKAGLKLVVGDRVMLEEDPDGELWAITEIEPRVTQLARREPGRRHGERIVVANVDQVVVVFAAANPEPHRRMLDRFLVIAEGNDLRARIVINKVDLADEPAVRERFADYVAAGYPVHFTSVRRNVGLSELHDVLAGCTSALSGPSGVGKSSLLNAMYPGLNLRVGAISESVNKGRHTTVGSMLHPLPDDGYVADTPGLREVGLWGLPPEHLDACFPEFRAYLDLCRFRDCSHQMEPGCAVRGALETGAVSAERYDSYVKLRGELEVTEQLRSLHSR